MKIAASNPHSLDVETWEQHIPGYLFIVSRIRNLPKRNNSIDNMS